MNLPNKLTSSRFFLAALLMVLLVVDFRFSKTLALLVFIVAALTDYLDGQLARKKYGVTNFGKLMDPLADKVMVCAALVGFVEIRMHSGGPSLVPAFVVVIIIAREFLVTGLRLLAASQGKVLAAGNWGKHKTAWQMIAIIWTLAGLALLHDILPAGELHGQVQHWFPYSVWAAMAVVVAITVISGGIYFFEQRQMILESS